VCPGDVADHAFSGDENVFYLFNPFDAVILGRFVENVGRSLASHPRQIWLIYNTPLHADVVERSGLFTRAETITVGGIACHVYTHPRPEAGAPKNEADRPAGRGGQPPKGVCNAVRPARV
jgi:hypothetical protein